MDPNDNKPFDEFEFDKLCSEFEAECKRQERPQIEHYVDSASPARRADLLYELLQIELWWRRDETPSPNEQSYQARFPVNQTIVSDAFKQFRHRSRVALIGEKLKDSGETQTFYPRLDPAAQQTLPMDTEKQAVSTSTGDRVKYFGEYELLEEVARGGMGVVFKARQVKLNRIVALKMILSGELAGEEQVQRFKSEAEAAARLDHPGIVPIFEIGEHDGQHYFSMGFVDGESLAGRLRQGPLPPNEAARLLVNICDTVAYAHDKGVIHRDLKPGNVLIDKSGAPRVTDFGLAKQVDRDSEMTKTGQVLGTPAYMPPEQASGNTDEIGPAADVYSLGAMLYAMLTGRPPFQASSPIETLRQVLEQEPASPRLQNAQIPKDLDTICLKCLNKEIEKRFESADALAADLRRYLAGEPIHARATSRSEKVSKWCKRNPRTVVATSLVVVLLVAVGIVIAIARDNNTVTRLQTTVAALNSVKGVIRPPLNELDAFPRELVLEELRAQFAESANSNRLPLAYALAHFGDVRVDYLVSQVEQAMPDEGQNIVHALRLAKQDALTAIAAKAEICDSKSAEPDSEKLDSGTGKPKYAALRYKARLAMLSLHLGNSSLAKDMCQLGTDPIQRTVFVDEGSTWCGDLLPLSDEAKTFDNADLRSAICLVVGSVPPDKVTQTQKKAWQTILSDWHVSQPDTGTHSASGWALREWGLPIPELPEGEPALGKDQQQQSVDVALNVTDLRQRIRDFEGEIQKLQGSLIGTELAVIAGEHASISASGTHVAFVTTVPKKLPLRLRDLNSSNDRELGQFAGDPTISPGPKNLIAMVSDDRNYADREVLLLNPEDDSIRSLGLGSYPTWSHDGSKLFFRSKTGPVMAIDVFDINASPKILIDKCPSLYPAVSPDATKIAWSGGGGLEVVDIATRKVIARHAIKGWNGHLPGWAPDNRHVGFGSYAVGDERGLWILDTETGRSYKAVAGNVTRPSWSGDGSRMLYEDRTMHQIHVVEWSWDQQRLLAEAEQTVRHLRQELAKENVRQSNFENGDRQWRVNGVGLTMLRIPAGTIQNNIGRTIEVKQDFLIGDREITVGQFQQFIDDFDYPSNAKPRNLPDVDLGVSPTDAHPVQNVCWYDAALFCNWLSFKEGLPPFYQHNNGKSMAKDFLQPDSTSIGYRLPTADEFEYAGRAGTTKSYYFGDEKEWMDAYGVCRATSAEPCGSRLPNGWGLFDVHGNVGEWLNDSVDVLQRLTDDGNFASLLEHANFAIGIPSTATMGYEKLGFRLAAFPPGKSNENVAVKTRDSPVIAQDPAPSIAPTVALNPAASLDMKRTTITTNQGRGADCDVDRTSRGEFTGLNRTLRIRSYNSIGMQHSYLRFDLAKIEDNKKNVTSAGIVLMPVKGRLIGSTIRVHGVPVAKLWPEMEVEWNNSFSKMGIDSLPLLCEITLNSKNVYQDGDLTEIRLSTPELAKFIQNAPSDTITLVVSGAGDVRMEFNSGESPRPPKLVVLTPKIPLD